MSSSAGPVANNGDTSWMLASTALVLLMTPGLAFFYGGLVGSKNVLNTMMMSFVTISVVTIQWTLFGFSLAFAPGSPGMGNLQWGGLKDVGITPDPLYAATIPFLLFAMYQLMFAAITPAIISGSIAERMKFSSWVIFTVIWSTIVYDLVAHMVWAAYPVENSDGTTTIVFGWLRAIGAIDFAGGTVVHMTSGFSALAAALVLGPRKDWRQSENRPANVPFVILGTALLWFGWFGFNAGSALSATGDGVGPSATIAFTTTQIAAAAASLTWLALDSVFAKPSVVGACIGAVVGLVVITPASGFVVPGYAIIIGAAGTAWVYLCSKLKVRYLNRWLPADDVLDVFVCHGQGGAAGCFLAGCFATVSVNPAGVNGAFYGNPVLLGYQMVAILIVAVTSIGLTTILLLVLKYTIGIRSSDDAEHVGLDKHVHGESHLDDVDQLWNVVRDMNTKVGQPDGGGSPRRDSEGNGGAPTHASPLSPSHTEASGDDRDGSSTTSLNNNAATGVPASALTTTDFTEATL